jgi:hypothetical protein
MPMNLMMITLGHSRLRRSPGHSDRGFVAATLELIYTSPQAARPIVKGEL